MNENQKVLTGLQRELIWYALACVFFFAVGFLGLWKELRPIDAWIWLAASSTLFAYTLRTVWVNLRLNRRAEQADLFCSLGAGNLTSLVRGALVIALFGWILIPKPESWLAWLPGGIYSLAVVIDAIDGVIARLMNQVTRLGEILDMFFDGLGMLAATALLVHYGQVPAWYLLVGMARYLFLFGMWLRERLGKVNLPLPASNRRRWMAAVQMGFVSVVLFPVFSPPGTTVMAYAFGIPFLVGFLWDWLYVSGVVTEGFEHRYAGIRHFASRWVPLGLRLGMVVVSFQILTARESGDMLTWLGWVVWLLLITGTAGRIASIAGLILLGLEQMRAPLSSIQLISGLLFALILLTGSGAFSLWKPENVLINKRLGEQHRRKFPENLGAETR